ncbi:hypothetical protein HJG60_010692 [Phyllostomus discolor]|uniref:Uncharacterized protein n=1 Tax=Phyllostomus discolor TaxID=89673 RepID=A0A834ANP5_9CHIR|nr:hypothetical protein HJG60_010692 [Phyllostomus discolor]
MSCSHFSGKEQSGYFSLSGNLLVPFPARWTHAAVVSYLPRAVGYLNVLLTDMCKCVDVYMNIGMCANIICNSRFIVEYKNTEFIPVLLFIHYCILFHMNNCMHIHNINVNCMGLPPLYLCKSYVCVYSIMWTMMLAI